MNERNPGPARTFSALSIIAIVTMLLLLATTAYLLHTNRVLRQELASREHLLPTQKQSESEARKAETDQENQRRVKEHLELLSLRGRVAQLTRELRERTNPATA